MNIFKRKEMLVGLSSVCSVLPYIILWVTDLADFPKTYEISLLIAFIGSLIWLFTTVAAWKKARSLAWLFAFFPIAFGPWLFFLYFSFHAWLFGFAP